MLGTSPNVMIHKLNIDPNPHQVQQNERSFTPEWQRVIEEEVNKLLMVGFIRDAHYPEWIVNIIMVRKPHGE